MLGSFSKLCGGNVRPSRIVTLQTDGTVIECDGTTLPWGIAQPSTHKFPITGWDDGYAGVSGSPPINIFGPGDDECPLVLGGTVTVGQQIKASTGGVGIAATANLDRVIAIAHKVGGAIGDVIPVKPIRYDVSST